MRNDSRANAFVLFGRMACIVPNDTGIIRNDFCYIVRNRCGSNVRNTKNKFTRQK